MSELIEILSTETTWSTEESTSVVSAIRQLGGNVDDALKLYRMFGLIAITEYVQSLQYLRKRGNVNDATNQKVKAIKETTQKYSYV